MIVLIILAVVFVIGIALIILFFKDIYPFGDHAICVVIGASLFIIAIIGLLCCGVMAINQAVNKDVEYQSTLYEKQVLEYRLEHIDDNLVGSEMLYADITEFNNNLRYTKRYSKSPWVGLFFNDKVATIDYIEISKFGGSECRLLM